MSTGKIMDGPYLNPDRDEPWERILRWRMMSATAAVRALKAKKRNDIDAVLRTLWQAADNLDFHCSVNPDRASGWVVETLRDILAGCIDELDAMIEKAAEEARRDDDEGEDHARL